MSSLRIGLVGYGAWTRSAYLPALRRDGRAEIISVAAPTDATRARAVSELGSNVAAFPTVEEQLQGLDVDAVLIAVPDVHHEDALLAVLASGTPCLYEPPITATRARIAPVLRRLLSAEQITCADLELALIPAVQRAAELLAQGVVGGVQMARIRLQSGWGPVPDYDLCNLNHLCTWYVDVLNRILDAKPRRVLVRDGHGTPGRRQSQTIGLLDYGDVLGTLQANIACVGDQEIGVEINGSDGDILIDLWSGDVSLRTRESTAWTTESWRAIEPYADWPGMHESITGFLDAVEGNQPAAYGAESVAELQLVGLAAEESLDSGTWADVPTLEDFQQGR